MPYADKETRNAYMRAYYRRNKGTKQEWKKADKGEKRRWLREYKTEKPCFDCENIYPYYCMDFDHRDPTTKKYTIGRMQSHSFETIQTEIDKCDLVCANCHRIRTYKDREDLH